MNLDGGGKVRMIEIPHMTGRGLEAVKKKKKKKKDRKKNRRHMKNTRLPPLA